ncbi:hypothetical protein [Chryseobacterium hagamense]|uniref:Uncharacterized protein n=1 Tax=Chryseobacterium hagamense TaxID=395935 RepID=A0A511YSU3_9FLAO|nr:hypothetical protein [Chryseobacterium hagamense]GEN78253.1 hypothetical protein CHA01nite_39930 [Chryseobacterium hagamense]
MKKIILYSLLLSGLLFIAGAYIHYQYQYKKFEDFFMNSRIYGSEKIIIDTTLSTSNKKFGLRVRNYKYSFFLKNKKDAYFTREFFTTISVDNNLNVIGNGGAGDNFFNEVPIFGINNIIYVKFIPEKWVPNKSSAYYVVIEYEKDRKIQYYIEIKEKIQNYRYSIYFKSYPPKMILNTKNEYIKD